MEVQNVISIWASAVKENLFWCWFPKDKWLNFHFGCKFAWATDEHSNGREQTGRWTSQVNRQSWLLFSLSFGEIRTTSYLDLWGFHNKFNNIGEDCKRITGKKLKVCFYSNNLKILWGPKNKLWDVQQSDKEWYLSSALSSRWIIRENGFQLWVIAISHHPSPQLETLRNATACFPPVEAFSSLMDLADLTQKGRPFQSLGTTCEKPLSAPNHKSRSSDLRALPGWWWCKTSKINAI